MVNPFMFAFISACALIGLVHAQDQSGFISIDCGIADKSSYTDGTTGINYVSDVDYIDTGVSKSISPLYKTNDLEQQFSNVRSFPQGIKNCYTITLPQFNGKTKYLVRARFLYGNYDAKTQVPIFDMYLGVHYWDTIEFDDAATVLNKEIIHDFLMDYASICLINTGRGTPFISALELRLMDSNIYVAKSGSLALFGRYDMRASTTYNDQVFIRYEDDIFDRIWKPPFHTSWSSEETTQLKTSLTVSTTSQDTFTVPSVVMATAVTPHDVNGSLKFYWIPLDSNTDYYIFMHFADLQFNQSRIFNIYLNDTLWSPEFLEPVYLSTITIHNKKPSRVATVFNFSIQKTHDSILPPILNALEIYTVKGLSSLQTDQGDVDAMKSIKSAYGLKKNWQGDPCSPFAYSWEGLSCINDSSNPPRIISLNLSLSGLTGKISTSISNLKMLQSLDLSNNSLTGKLPDFLTQMEELIFLKLSGNNLKGTVPAELIERWKSGTLSLNLDPNLCLSEPCETPKKKNKSMIVPIVAAAATVSALLLAFAIWWMFFLKKKKLKQQQQEGMKAKLKGRVLDTAKRQFTYSEVLSITNNLERVIGKGGFGPVYHGYLGDTEVAVKMLSSSSVQGYKEFHAEIELLTRVHHRNLTSLIGFCNEGDNIGLLYEYMANGNLKEHLSDRSPNVLSWGERLQIALDAATGLEYLHTGCKPPIIHRDVKSANILLNEKFEAKLADFGLSKDFPVDNTHVSTAVAGTPGYLDPEYYISYKLTEKSDIFSFGVVLLEIITSRPVITRDQDNAHISQWVSFRLAREEDVRSIVDARLGADFEVNSIQKAIEIAMACASPTSIQRPTMNHVVMELKQCLTTEMARMNEGDGTELEDSSAGASLNFITQSSFGAR